MPVMKTLKDTFKASKKGLFTACHKTPTWRYDFEVIVTGRYKPANGDKAFGKNTYKTMRDQTLTKEKAIITHELISMHMDEELRIQVWTPGKKKDSADVINDFIIPHHELLGAAMGKCTAENPEQKSSMLLELTGKTGLVVLQLNSTELKIGKNKKMNLYVDVLESVTGVGKTCLCQSNCVYKTNTTGEGGDVSWNQMIIHNTEKYRTKSSFIIFRLMAWNTTSESSEKLLECFLKGDYFEKEPGTVHTDSLEFQPIDEKKGTDVCKMDMTFFYQKDFPTLLEYRKGGFSIHADFHADEKADKGIVAMLKKDTNAVLEHWKDKETDLSSFTAKGKTFSDLLNNSIIRAKKIKTGKGYLIFVYFAGSSDHKDISLERLQQSSLLPMSVVIIRADKMSGKWLYLDEIREAICAENTDFLDKKNKKRNNLDIYTYTAQDVKENSWAAEERRRTPLNRIGKHIAEYLYVNDIQPCKPFKEPPMKTFINKIESYGVIRCD